MIGEFEAHLDEEELESDEELEDEDEAEEALGLGFGGILGAWAPARSNIHITCPRLSEKMPQ